MMQPMLYVERLWHTITMHASLWKPAEKSLAVAAKENINIHWGNKHPTPLSTTNACQKTL